MKKLIFLFAFMFVASLGYSQLKVVAPGDVGIGTGTPAEKLDVVGNIQMTHSSGNNVLFSTNTPTFTIEKTTATGSALVDISCLPLDGTSAASFRFFRTTNTTGLAKFDVHAANNTSAVNCRIGGNTTSFLSAISGNVSIGQTAPGAEKLYVVGDIFATGTITPSDKRLKNDETDFDYGLEAVLQMRPVSYTYNGKMDLNTNRVHVGVIAQELQKIVPPLVEEFTYVKMDDAGEEVILEEQYLKIRDSEIKYLLVNAIQEQNEEIETLEEKVVELEEKLNRVLEGLSNNTLRNDSDNNQLVELYGDKGRLQQNIPNPFNETTIIKYIIPERASNSYVQIFDINGAVLKTVQLNTKGVGQLTIKANELAPGAYMYNLVIDGQLVDTKKMVLTK